MKKTTMTTSPIIMFIKEFFRLSWLSVSSFKFYPDVYKKYKGFGLKYAAVVITLTTLAYAIFIIDAAMTVRAFLISGEEENNPVEYLLRQWPEVKYNGKEISFNSDEPIIIKSMRGNASIGIDPDNKLPILKKQTLSMVFQKKQLLLYIGHGDGSTSPQEMAFGYGQIFGSEPLLLDYNGIKGYLLGLFQTSSFAFLLVGMPFFILLRMLSYIFSNLFIMGLLFIVLWALKLEPTIKSVCRVIVFVCAVPELISVLLMILEPRAIAIATLVQYWTMILAIYSLAKMETGKKR